MDTSTQDPNTTPAVDVEWDWTTVDRVEVGSWVKTDTAWRRVGTVVVFDDGAFIVGRGVESVRTCG